MKVRYRTYPVVRVCAEHSKEALPMECQVGHVVCGLYNIIYKILNNGTNSYYAPHYSLQI